MSKEQSTIVVYELTGSTRRFHVPFEYLSRQFVVVTVLGEGRDVLTLGSDYRFISPNEIETTVAYGGVDGNNFIEIRRVTSATDRLVEFSDGSVLRSQDMNVSAIQTIHIAEEARNLASDTLAADDDGNLDARGRRLVNLGNAVNPQDALTLDQVMGWSQSALNQANRSQVEADKSAASAAAALASQNAAAASKSAAKTSEIAANAARDQTEAIKDIIENADITSLANAQAALASKNAAAISEANAKDSELAALQYRNEAADFTPANHLLKASNLSDVEDKVASRTNLGLNFTDEEIIKLKALLVTLTVINNANIRIEGNIYAAGNMNAKDVYIRGE